MATENMNAVAEKNIVLVALADIQASDYNPRKNFDEVSLAELADSIHQQGLLQPIGVRPIGDNRFEIVFGERRYRASQLAGLEEIPAVVLNVSDEIAEEMTITENLQRKDVTPIEEANAYQRLIESGRHDVKSLSVQFGKNENYIRIRLKLLSLIPEIVGLLEKEEITISVASEISRYDKDIQQEVYDKHLREDVRFNRWRGMKASEVAKNIERQFTADLNRYQFDKTLCLSCPHNTNNMGLFAEGGCGHCAKRACLAEMNTAYMVEKAVQMQNEYPTASLAYRRAGYNEDAVTRLVALGHEVAALDIYPNAFPVPPYAPEKENCDTPEEYEEDCRAYEEEMADYKEECDELLRASAEGEVSLYLVVGQDNIALCYTENARNMATANQQPTPVEKLEKQDKRNREIAIEKTIEDTKKQIFEVDMTETKFGADEDKMIYFFLLPYLRKENFKAVGIEKENGNAFLTDEERMHVVANLTAREKAVIRRDFLISQFKSGAYRGNATADLLLEFARKHMPEALAGIEDKYNEVYEKRHQRIEEKKAVLQVQEQAKQEAEQVKEDIANEQQPQSQEAAA